MPNPIKLFLVDDHAVVRQGTREMLNRNPQFMVVGEAESGENLPGILKLSNPDVLLLDINLPGKNGLELLEELRPLFPTLKIILFSAHSDLQYIRKAHQIKADGFLSKTIQEQELHQAILDILNGTPAPLLSSDLESKYAETLSREAQNPLTARELEILGQLAQGLTNQAIAKALCLSVKTVDTHVANLIKKTGVSNRTQLLAFAYEQGLL